MIRGCVEEGGEVDKVEEGDEEVAEVAEVDEVDNGFLKIKRLANTKSNSRMQTNVHQPKIFFIGFYCTPSIDKSLQHAILALCSYKEAL